MIQGGQAVLGQWVEQGRDQNVTCGTVHRDLGRWFHQYSPTRARPTRLT